MIDVVPRKPTSSQAVSSRLDSFLFFSSEIDSVEIICQTNSNTKYYSGSHQDSWVKVSNK